MARDRALQAQQETIRVPVYGTEEYDPFGGNMDQGFINCFPEAIKDSTTGEGFVRVIKREGIQMTDLDIFSSTGAASREALKAKSHIVVTQLDDIFVVAFADASLGQCHIIQYRPNTGTITKIGSFSIVDSTDFIHLSECQIAVDGVIRAGITVVYTNSNRTLSKCYWAVSNGSQFSASTLTQITNVSFPDQQTPALVVTGPIQQMRGLFYAYTTNGIIWNSGSTGGTENDPTSWSTLSKIETHQYPDGGIGICRYKHHIVAFGKDSIEFFNDVGNPPPANSLEATEQAFIKFGTISPLLVINIDDTLYWLAYSSTKTVGIWKLEGYTPVKISTGKQDYSIQKNFSEIADTLSNYWFYTIVFQGKKHLGFAGIVQSTSLWNVEEAHWGNPEDTFFYDLQNTGGDAESNDMMYNVEDKTWWSYRNAFARGQCLLPATIYPGSLATTFNTYYNQYVFNVKIGSPSIGKINTVVHRVNPFNYEGFFFDSDPDEFYGYTDLPIPTIIQTNTMSFGNVHRKRISRFQPVFTTIPAEGFGSPDTNIYSMALFVNKKNLADGTGLIQKVIPYPNAADRYYWNNLGTSRYFQFTWCTCHKDSLSILGYDITVHQGTH